MVVQKLIGKVAQKATTKIAPILARRLFSNLNEKGQKALINLFSRSETENLGNLRGSEAAKVFEPILKNVKAPYGGQNTDIVDVGLKTGIFANVDRGRSSLSRYVRNPTIIRTLASGEKVERKHQDFSMDPKAVQNYKESIPLSTNLANIDPVKAAKTSLLMKGINRDPAKVEQSNITEAKKYINWYKDIDKAMKWDSKKGAYTHRFHEVADTVPLPTRGQFTSKFSELSTQGKTNIAYAKLFPRLPSRAKLYGELSYPAKLMRQPENKELWARYQTAIKDYKQYRKQVQSLNMSKALQGWGDIQRLGEKPVNMFEMSYGKGMDLPKGQWSGIMKNIDKKMKSPFWGPIIQNYFGKKFGFRNNPQSPILNYLHPTQKPYRWQRIAPTHVSGWERNQILHNQAEDSLFALISRENQLNALKKKGSQILDREGNQSNYTAEMKVIKDIRKKIHNDMEKLGIESELKNPVTGAITKYGKKYKRMIKDLYEDMSKSYDFEFLTYKGKNFKPENLNQGGFMDYGEMKPVVPPLDPGERQHLQLGGKAAEAAAKAAAKAGVKYIKRQVLPKVIGHTTKIMEKLAAPKKTDLGPDLSTVRTDLYTPPKGPYTVTDDSGVTVLDKQYKTLDEAQAALKALSELRTQDASSFKIFGARPPKTAEGVSEAAPEVEVGMIGKVVTEETPAMMWKAPEIIKNAPMEIAQGKQWYGILKKAGVSPKELDDTSLGPFLDIQQPNTKFTKAELLEQFDSLAPKIEVLATGKREQEKYLQNILTKFNSVRDSISDFSGKDQGVLNSFTGILEKAAGAKTDTQLNVLANQTNKLMKQAYGVDNALMSDQIPAIRQIPAPIRSIFGDMQELFKTRGAAHAFDKKPSHAGDQVLPGGVNYREYMFKYTPNQLRFTEPTYKPGHTFDFSDEVAKNTFVHARISDRTDNFGRKLLFVEEIQSDMHQRPQKAIRQGKPSGYATRKDKILSAQTYIDEMAVLQNKIDAILAREPNHTSLPALYKKRGTLAAKIEKIRGTVSGGGDIPEGPFQRSEDYGSFVVKYLLRLAKEGNYDGVAVSTGNIKNRRGYGSQDEQKGHYGFYDKIMQKVLKKIAKNADLEYNRTVINDGAVNWGNVPILILKEMDKVMKGLPSFREGGLNRENFVDVVPLL